MSDRATHRRGLSLVELIIVLNIIAALAALSVPLLRTVRARGRENSCRANLQTTWLALGRYKADYKKYPAYLTDLYPGYVDSLESFVCPADPRRAEELAEWRKWADGEQPDPAWMQKHAPTLGLNLLYSRRESLETGQEIVCGCPFHQRGLVQTLDGAISEGEFQTATLKSPVQTSVFGRGAGEPAAASEETTLFAGDTVVTATGGSAIIAFSEGSTVALGGNTQVTLKVASVAEQPTKLVRILGMFLGDPAGPPATVDCNVVHGPYTGGGGRFEVRTPTLMGGVRGTRFRVLLEQVILDGRPALRTTLCTLSGAVEVRANGKTKKVVQGDCDTETEAVTSGGKGKGKGKGKGGGDDDGDDEGFDHD